MDLFSCCRDGKEAEKTRHVFASLDDETEADTSSLPDLDAATDNEGDGSPTNYSHSSSSLFELAEEERGVTVVFFNFLMVLFGLSNMNIPSRRKAIAAA